MLLKPSHGWTVVKIGNQIIGSASYLDDIPMDLLDTFLSYFHQENKYLPFSFLFDAEGYHFGILEFNDSLYTVSTDTNSEELMMKPINPVNLNLDWFSHSNEVLKVLAKEVISDIQNYISDWVYWPDSEEELSKENAEIRKYNLLQKCEELSLLVK